MKIENTEIDHNYLTSDIKLQAFLRLVLPASFIGLNKTSSHRVNFVFKKSQELTDFVTGYLNRKEYLISPLLFAENIDQAKAMIHGDY